MNPSPPSRRITPAQWALAFLIFALAAARIAYAFMQDTYLRQTALFFVGLPALLAIILTLTPRAQTLLGMVMKATTIALLASGILLQEGFICILMAAPLFYFVAAMIAIIATQMKKKRDLNRPSNLLVLLPIVLLSLEGITPQLSFNRSEIVISQQVIQAAPAQVESALSQTPLFDLPLPPFFALGFPHPVSTSGSGLNVGDQRVIAFAPMGELILQISARTADSVTFTPVSDTTPISGWLAWREILVTWAETANGQTLVTWTLHYDRLLDPAWYFAPLEHYGVALAGDYLIATLATP